MARGHVAQAKGHGPASASHTFGKCKARQARQGKQGKSPALTPELICRQRHEERDG
jgi:hypothetical protein